MAAAKTLVGRPGGADNAAVKPLAALRSIYAKPQVAE
jgi:hypothetical protein